MGIKFITKQQEEDNEFLDAGGSIRWTEKGANIFIPAEFISWWPAVVLDISEDGETITLSCAERKNRLQGDHSPGKI